MKLPIYIGSFQFAGENDHILGREDFVEVFSACVKNLERSPYLWSFLGKKVHFEKDTDQPTPFVTDETEIYKYWGKTPQDALIQAAEHSGWLLEKGFTSQIQDEMFKLQNLPNLPLEDDQREFEPDEPLWDYLKNVI